jgi:hypothetical protein
MKTFYCCLSTLAAFLCLNLFYISDNEFEIEQEKVQHIDMSDHTIFINVKKGK